MILVTGANGQLGRRIVQHLIARSPAPVAGKLAVSVRDPGKAADLCAVRVSDPDALPCFHPVSHLVHVLGRHDVSDVWVAGRPRVQGGRLLQITNTELLSTARLWQNKLRQ